MAPLTTRNVLAILLALPVRVFAGDILSTSGYTTCVDNPSVKVTALDIQFDKSTGTVTFNVGGESTEVQNVTAALTVTAYGKQVYQKDFNPCDSSTFVKQLCPVPAGNFSAAGSQVIPQSYIDMVPSIAFTIPDLDGAAKLELKTTDGTDLACIQSTVSNGKTLNVPAVGYVAAGVAGGALALSALSMIASGGAPGAPTASPNFGEVLGWFQTLATSGMLSVKYPSVYLSFTKNFAFSTGLIPWGQMQTTIDRFRQSTGGNLTQDSYAYLQNVTIVPVASGNASLSSTLSGLLRRSVVLARDVTTTVDGQTTTLGASNGTSTNGTQASKEMHYVQGIQAYVEQLMVPQANTFMTVLLVFALVVAAITVFILIGKLILEGVALIGTLPKSLESFRKRYWWRLAKTITNLILLLYGIWTLYCVYQFTNGDSWAAKALAAVTWALFTSLLAFFTWRIWRKAHQFKQAEGDTSGLFEDKEVWIKYSLFYDSFKKGYWWIFIPAIVYMFARNTVIAAANGHGMVQAIGQLVVESIMLILLVWSRPYQLKSGNIINIFIQVVRVLSVVCILVFVEELGISQTTQTITGVVLIVVQSVMTGLLAILLAVNAIMVCVKENPHRKKRKDAEKAAQRDRDTLTPLGPHNSLLMGTDHKAPVTTTRMSPMIGKPSHGRYESLSTRDVSPAGSGPGRGGYGDESRVNLVRGAASMGVRDRSSSPKPTLPNVGFGRAY